MLADQSDAPADAQVVEHFGIGDFDPETVKQYRNRFASRDPDHPWLSEDDAGLLLKLGALRRERATGVEGATVVSLDCRGPGLIGEVIPAAWAAHVLPAPGSRQSAIVRSPTGKSVEVARTKDIVGSRWR